MKPCPHIWHKVKPSEYCPNCGKLRKCDGCDRTLKRKAFSLAASYRATLALRDKQIAGLKGLCRVKDECYDKLKQELAKQKADCVSGGHQAILRVARREAKMEVFMKLEKRLTECRSEDEPGGVICPKKECYEDSLCRNEIERIRQNLLGKGVEKMKRPCKHKWAESKIAENVECCLRCKKVRPVKTRAYNRRA